MKMWPCGWSRHEESGDVPMRPPGADTPNAFPVDAQRLGDCIDRLARGQTPAHLLHLRRSKPLA